MSAPIFLPNYSTSAPISTHTATSDRPDVGPPLAEANYQIPILWLASFTEANITTLTKMEPSDVNPLEDPDEVPEPEEPACFPLDTYVHTDQGILEIQYIAEGTLVLARSDVTGEQAYRRVVKTFVHEDRQTYRIEYVNPEGKTAILYATPEHPFWVKDHGWTPAGRLQSGHVLEICDPDGYDEGYRRMGSLQELALSGGRWSATVVSVAESDLVTTVYNFEVEEFHTYFVGVFGVWVHNIKSPSRQSSRNPSPMVSRSS